LLAASDRALPSTFTPEKAAEFSNVRLFILAMGLTTIAVNSLCGNAVEIKT
jgi:hypothetical protein